MFDLATPSSSSRRAITEGRIRNSTSNYGVRYPNPFFDIAHTYLPSTPKELFHWCRFFYLTNPLIAATTNKLAEYPITDVVVDSDNSGLLDKWTSYLEDTLQIRSFLVELGIYVFCLGNGIVSLSHPFIKWLTCGTCHHRVQAQKSDFRYSGYKFFLKCPSCGADQEAQPYDQYVKSAQRMRLVIWEPEDLEIEFNSATGESVYWYTLPRALRNKITIGKREVIAGMPQLFLDAARMNKQVVLAPDNVFHIKRPSLFPGGQDKGWGCPLIFPVLKDVFQLQLMKKSTEAILLERIVPLTVLFPQAGSASSDPFTGINLMKWKNQIAEEIERWRCISPESLVESKEGLVAAEDVQVGDLLKNRYGEYTKVVEVNRRKLDPGERAFQLNVRGQRAIQTVFSEEHPLWAAKKFNNGNLGCPKFIRVDQLKPGDYVGYPITRQIKSVEYIDLADHVDRAVTENWVYVDHIEQDVPEAFEYLEKGGNGKRSDVLERFGWGLNSYKIAQLAIREGRCLRRTQRRVPFDKELAYVLGFYAAEGSTTPKGILFAIHDEKTHIIERLDAFFLERFSTNRTQHRKSEHGILIAYHNVIAAQLFHSLIPGVSRTKRLPEIIRQAPHRIMLSAIKGLYEDKTTLCSSSIQLAEDVRQLLLSQEIMVGISYEKSKESIVICGKQTRSSGSYSVQVSGTYHQKLQALLGEDTYQGKLWSKLGVFSDGFAWFRIAAIEEAEPKEVIGFEVDGDHTFCTWGVSTHNCDRNYIPILPLPIGSQNIGGDGRALLMSQEIRAASELIISGMGVPAEFYFGGLSWSGSQVSLRMVENFFLGHLSGISRLLRTFIVPRSAEYLGWVTANTRLKPFKSADDLQRKALYLQKHQMGMLSKATVLRDGDFNPEDEEDLIASEADRQLETMKKQQLAQAELQGEIQVITARYQAKVQRVMMEEQQQMQAGMVGSAPGEPGEATGSQPGLPVGSAPQGPPPQQMVEQLAQQLSSVSEGAQQQALQSMGQQNPQLAQAVAQALQGLQGANGGGSENLPLPGKLPPRRGAESALI